MRILHIETRHRKGGAERNVIHTANWETDQGHEVHIAVGRDSLLVEIPPSLTPHVIEGLVRDLSPRDEVRAYRSIRRLVSRLAFDVVHTHQSKAGVIGRLAARGHGASIVHTVHMASFGPAYGRVNSALFAAAERYCARYTDLIVTVGEELKEMYLAAGVGRSDQYAVIRSPIDVTQYSRIRSARPRQRADVRKRLGLDDRPIALVVSTLEPRKRVGLIVQELRPALAAGEILLLVAGEGAERSAIEYLSSRLGVRDGVRLLGHVEDVPEVMAAADVLVHAATVEGVPQVVIQGLVAGLPVVATEMIGLREINGASIVVVPATGHGLGAAVTGAITNPPPPPPLSAFAPWSSEQVDEGLQQVHDEILLRRQAAGVRPT